MRGELGRRVAVGVVAVPLALAATWLGGWPLAALLAAVAGVAAHEFYGLARARGVRPFAAAGVVAAIALVLLAQARGGAYAPWAAPAMGLLLVLLGACVVAAVWLRWPAGEPVTAAALTLTGALYTGGALAFGVFLRDAQPAFLLLPLLTTWIGDSAAYFVGRAFGRRKLIPLASPGKTVEGAVAGLVGSAAAAGLLAWGSLYSTAPLRVSVPVAIALGVALGVAAQLGDAAESVMKRWAGVKDSGTLLPGHGGMLDRIDALLLAFPAAYALLVLTGVRP